MNLKIEALKAVVFLALGGFLFVSYWPKPKPPPPVAIPESEEVARLKKRLAEFSSKKKSVLKEFNCANGALSKELTVDEETASKIAKEAAESEKKVSELVVQSNGPRDNFKLNLNSKLQPGVEISPVEHYWIGFKHDFKVNERIYEIGYSNRIF